MKPARKPQKPDRRTKGELLLKRYKFILLLFCFLTFISCSNGSNGHQKDFSELTSGDNDPFDQVTLTIKPKSVTKHGRLNVVEVDVTFRPLVEIKTPVQLYYSLDILDQGYIREIQRGNLIDNQVVPVNQKKTFKIRTEPLRNSTFHLKLQMLSDISSDHRMGVLRVLHFEINEGKITVVSNRFAYDD
jgi:hypothetical protein